MRAVVVTEPGGPEVLQVQELADPVPGPGQAVVRLAAANINPTDEGGRQGFVLPGFSVEGPPYVLGWDLSGEVVAVGEGVDNVAVGDPVVGMIHWYSAGGRYGAYAELVLVEAAWLVARPEGLDPIEAATLPLNALTAAQSLVCLGAPEGAEVLITGASGGVGTFAAQLATAQGLRVTAVAGTDDEEWVRSLGVERVLPRDVDYAQIGSFSYVFDTVPLGPEVFPAAADGATIVSTRPIAEEAGRGITQRSWLIEQDTPGLERVVAMAAAGKLRTRVARAMPLADAAEAHRTVGEPGRRGKIVLVP